MPDPFVQLQCNKLHKAMKPTEPAMPLHAIMKAMDQAVKPEVTKEIVRYMKGMPSEHEHLVLQCAEQLDRDQSLRTVLAVVHALNEGEFLLKCRDDDILSENELSKEFDKLMGSSNSTPTEPATLKQNQPP